MTIIAGVLSFAFWGKLNGVREGTIIAALLVGFIARLFGKHLGFIKEYLFPEEQNAEQSKATDTENIQHKNVIVIGRQYGSGGHDIGKMLADKLGYEFYDLRREDKMRADNYRYYTGRIWGAASNFDITINTDRGIPYIEKCIDDAL